MSRSRLLAGAALMLGLAGVVPSVGAFEGIRVTLLGTGADAPDLQRAAPGTLIEAASVRLLVDGGVDVSAQLTKIGLGPAGINVLLLPHLRPEHTAGLAELWLRGWREGRRGALLVIGPQGTQALVEELQRARRGEIAADLQRDPDGLAIEVQEIEENQVFEDGGVVVTAIVVEPAPSGPAYAFRVEYRGRAAVLSGDTRYARNLVGGARGASVILHEVTASGPDPAAQQAVRDSGHSAPEEAAEVFRAARPGLAVYTHIDLGAGSEEELVRRTRKIYGGPLVLGRDLMVIEIQNEVQVRGQPSEPR